MSLLSPPMLSNRKWGDRRKPIPEKTSVYTKLYYDIAYMYTFPSINSYSSIPGKGGSEKTASVITRSKRTIFFGGPAQGGAGAGVGSKSETLVP